MSISRLSHTEWWIAAVVSGVALAVALASLFPTRRGKWGAVLIVLATAVYVALRAPSGGENGERPAALMVFTGVAVYLVLMQVTFAGWSRRQEELVRLGRPVEKLKARHYALFALGFVVVGAVIRFL